MKRVLTLRSLKRGFQLLLCVSLAIWFLAPVSSAHAVPIKPQASSFKCQSTPTHFAIPANLDLLHASTQELRQNHLPSRPPASDSQAVAHWMKMVQGIKQVACIAPGGKPLTYHGHPVTETFDSACTPPSGTQCSQNWNGYIKLEWLYSGKWITARF
jgi:hypothetical protein